ncbi:phosphatase PAP2 family protein [Nocardioides bruguierae]|uniref:Phosphatase PAP2 family protein n=1 Tax=Nocardioides bruguierae TaxID=2945102 RepID=A0A9X2DBG8_9ACTN|nr:phosphatase PAP2 family protein [Nocardioides bruguierae]MCL8026166.1 phosphatase PAP2 family protein [Nocardioides bruguierae]MCM0621509.1 phosphatase PAP2 family protein [Nocardioides bruguierae]
MYRRAYVLLVGTAAAMGLWAVVTALILGRPLVDPEGSFLGPSWLRLPLLLGGAVLVDLIPRTLWKSRLRPSAMKPVFMQRLRTHWTKDRLLLVFLGIGCFYVTYVCYRNLKSFLPFMQDNMYDRELHLLDRALFFGHDPAIVLHDLLGTNVAAWFLSYIYLWFLPLVPIAVTVWVVWSRNLSYGYWFVTAQCLAWSLGTISYYALPTLGPGLEYVSLYSDLAYTPTTSLMDSLVNSRQGVILGGLTGQVQSVAGFASLHCGITLLMALMVQYTLRLRWVKILFWANFAITVVATLYFGWHYVADDIAGITLALFSFYVAGLATGQRFDHSGLTSHPTTTGSRIPVGKD